MLKGKKFDAFTLKKLAANIRPNIQKLHIRHLTIKGTEKVKSTFRLKVNDG